MDIDFSPVSPEDIGALGKALGAMTRPKSQAWLTFQSPPTFAEQSWCCRCRQFVKWPCEPGEPGR